MVVTKNKANTIMKSLKKAAPNLSRVTETDNRNRIWVNPDMTQVEMLNELRFIADTLASKPPVEEKKIDLKDLIQIVGEDPRPDSDYDPVQLKNGIMIELEHTNDAKVAKKITKDHLDEFKNYYIGLKDLEEKLSSNP